MINFFFLFIVIVQEKIRILEMYRCHEKFWCGLNINWARKSSIKIVPER